MSVTSEARTSGLYQWLKSNGVVAITIIGVLLYIVFSIPSTFFYARLGTTPNEVGITYTSILSGSTLGALLVLVVLIFATIYMLMFFVGWLGFTVLNLAFNFLRHPRLILTRDQKLDVEHFELKLKIARNIHDESVSNWKEIERALRRNRELKREEYPIPADVLEMSAINVFWIYMRIPMSNVLYVRYLLRRSIRYIYPLFLLFIVTATVVLITIAKVQAGEVLQGKPFFGSQIGLFDYHAERVTIRPSSATTANSLLQLTGKQVFLLGENAQYVIVYSPDSRSTTRIPVSAVIVTSSP